MTQKNKRWDNPNPGNYIYMHIYTLYIDRSRDYPLIVMREHRPPHGSLLSPTKLRATKLFKLMTHQDKQGKKKPSQLSWPPNRISG